MPLKIHRFFVLVQCKEKKSKSFHPLPGQRHKTQRMLSVVVSGQVGSLAVQKGYFNPLLPGVIKTEFLLTISIHYQADK